MQAKLPPQLELVYKTLKIGQSIYVVPWAMRADLLGNLWLDLNFLTSDMFTSKPSGTACMKVTAIEYGYSVDLSESYCRNFRWPREYFSTHNYGVVLELEGV